MNLRTSILAAILLLGATHAASASPLSIPIRSGPDWRASETGPIGATPMDPADWRSIGFNDSGWATARAPYPNPFTPEQILGGPTLAQHMWLGDSTDGGGPPDEVFFRYRFGLSVAPNQVPIAAQLLISVDDDYELWVNGKLAFENKDDGFADQVDLVDITEMLQLGSNVLALHAVDGGWDNPRDRGYQRVTIDGVITTVPAPAGLSLLAMGLLALAVGRQMRIA